MHNLNQIHLLVSLNFLQFGLNSSDKYIKVEIFFHLFEFCVVWNTFKLYQQPEGLTDSLCPRAGFIWQMFKMWPSVCRKQMEKFISCLSAEWITCRLRTHTRKFIGGLDGCQWLVVWHDEIKAGNEVTRSKSSSLSQYLVLKALPGKMMKYKLHNVEWCL